MVRISFVQARGVVNPNRVLASPTTSMAWGVAYLPPAVRKGDRLDVEVRVGGNSETTSLRGGWMMETRFKEMAMLAGRVRDGHVMNQYS
jgi:flagellar basal body P-ring protein FlgI